jgi:hypothetical protein
MAKFVWCRDGALDCAELALSFATKAAESEHAKGSRGFGLAKRLIALPAELADGLALWFRNRALLAEHRGIRPKELGFPAPRGGNTGDSAVGNLSEAAAGCVGLSCPARTAAPPASGPAPLPERAARRSGQARRRKRRSLSAGTGMPTSRAPGLPGTGAGTRAGLVSWVRRAGGAALLDELLDPLERLLGHAADLPVGELDDAHRGAGDDGGVARLAR